MVFFTIDNHLCFTSFNKEKQLMVTKYGQFQILGVFPNTLNNNIRTGECYNYSLRDIQLTQAMIYAVDHLINQNPNLLPGINIGFTIVDSCSSRKFAMSGITSSLVTAQTDSFPQLSCDLYKPSINSTAFSNHSLSKETSDTDRPIIGVVGERNEPITISTASYTGSLNVPQISYNSFSALLNNRKLFPLFFRTTSSLHDQVKPLVDIITHFQWNWISAVIAGSDVAANIEQILSSSLSHHNICLAANIILSDNYTSHDLSRTVALLKHHRRSKVVILFGEEPIILDFLEMAQSKSLTGKTFLGTYKWMNSERLRNISADIVGGAIGIDFKRHSLKPFLNYLESLDLCNNVFNPWFTSAWISKLGISRRRPNWSTEFCQLDRRLKYSSFKEFYQRNYMSAFVIDAVLALAHAMHQYLHCNSHYCPPINSYQSLHSDPQFVRILRRISFSGVTSDSFKFNHEGNSKMFYNYIHLRPFRNATVNTFVATEIGKWKGIKGMSIDVSKIVWNVGHRGHRPPLSRCSIDCQPGYYRDRSFHINMENPICCWKCNKCKSNKVSTTINQDSCTACVNYTEPVSNHSQCVDMKIASFNTSNQSFALIFYIISSLFVVIVLGIWATVIKYRKTPVVKSSNFVLLNFFLFFNCLSVPSALLFLVPLHSKICQIQVILLSISEIGHVSTIICKANQIYLIFKMTSIKKGIRSKLVKNGSQIALIILIIIVSQSTITTLLIYQPIKVIKIVNNYNKIELMCDYKTNPAVLAYFVYFGILNIIAMILALRTRSLPDNYSEARYVFLSAMMIACVFSTSIPTIIGTNGLLNRTLTCLSVFLVGFISIMCFLSPKMYIIYCHPELNTTEHAAASVANYSFNNQRVSPISFSRKFKVAATRDSNRRKDQPSSILLTDSSNATDKEESLT